MLELKTKKELAGYAHTLAQGFSLVRYRNNLYRPADFETRLSDPTPDGDRTIWIPISREELRVWAADQFDALFGSDGELASFEFMVSQNAIQATQAAEGVLVSTERGLMQLNRFGKLEKTSGAFRPNAIVPMLNTDPDAKQRVFDVIVEWLNSEEEARSLLHHLATSLAPAWSAVKYILLLGDGRNGKSVLLKMLESLFGSENVSSVTRQAIAEQSAVVTELNGKLLNIVYDGQHTYVKDSGAEKSLIAGEPFSIRKLYESTPTRVQTTALFLEGLNREPKTGDKSSALQKRLVRYQFPNIYPLDHSFEKSMLTPGMLGAFLALLIDHYVTEDQLAVKLAPTAKAMELQLEQMFTNSIALQFLKHLEAEVPEGAISLIGVEVADLVTQFRSWRIRENDIGSWPEPDVVALFQPILNTERKSVRTSSGPRKVRLITSFKIEATAFIESMKGENTNDGDDELLAAVVEV